MFPLGPMIDNVKELQLCFVTISARATVALPLDRELKAFAWFDVGC